MATAHSIVNGGLPTPPLDATFHHDVKTSGQQPPLYEELESFAAFPDRIVGPTVWETQQFKESPNEWTHHFTKRELEELSQGADAFRAAGTPLIDIAKVHRIWQVSKEPTQRVSRIISHCHI